MDLELPLRFEGNLLKARDRYKHAAGKVTNFYKLQQNYKKQDGKELINIYVFIDRY